MRRRPVRPDDRAPSTGGRSRRAWRSTRSTARSSSARPRSSRIRWTRSAGRPQVLIIRMRNVPTIDSTAMHALKDLIRRTRSDGTRILLSDVHAQPLAALRRVGRCSPSRGGQSVCRRGRGAGRWPAPGGRGMIEGSLGLERFLIAHGALGVCRRRRARRRYHPDSGGGRGSSRHLSVSHWRSPRRCRQPSSPTASGFCVGRLARARPSARRRLYRRVGPKVERRARRFGPMQLRGQPVHLRDPDREHGVLGADRTPTHAGSCSIDLAGGVLGALRLRRARVSA